MDACTWESEAKVRDRHSGARQETRADLCSEGVQCFLMRRSRLLYDDQKSRDSLRMRRPASSFASADANPSRVSARLPRGGQDR